MLEREREILLYFRLRARWQAGGNLESSILLNPSCYYTFGVATLQIDSNLVAVAKKKLLLGTKEESGSGRERLQFATRATASN